MFGEVKVINSDEQVKTISKTLRDNGYYPYVTDEEEYNNIANDKDYFKKVLLKVMEEYFRVDISKIENNYRKLGVKLVYLAGNDDPKEFVNKIYEEYDNDVLIPIDEKTMNINDYMFLGFGYSNETPWHTARELPEREIEERLIKLFSGLNRNELDRTIAIIHVPPYGTTIDQAPKLTNDLKPVVEGGVVAMEHVGSTAVRRILENFGPLIGLHGHVHESYGIDFLNAKCCNKKIPVVNAGSEYQGGMLRFAYLMLEDLKLKDKIIARA